MDFFDNETVQIIIACAIPYITIGIISYGSLNNMYPWYNEIKKPTWCPPDWIVGPVWSCLYLAMGYASFRVWDKGYGYQDLAKLSLIFYVVQLLINASYTQVFFRLQLLGASTIHLIVLLIFIIITGALFMKVDNIAGVLMIPYAAWIAFASILSFTLWRLNSSPNKKNI